MIPTNATDVDPVNHDLPMELRRAGAVHRSENAAAGLMLTGLIAEKEHDGVISPHLLRQHLVVPAYPFRTTRLSATLR